MYKLLKKLKHHLITGIFVAVCWSWLLFIDVATISKNTGLATASAWLAFIIIVLVNTVIYTKVIRYIVAAKPATGLTLAKGVFIWAFAEWFTGWILAFIWFGKQASIDTVFPFASFTPLLMYTPLGFLARFTGFHGLSALFVTLLIVTVIPKFKKFRIPLYAACLAFILFGWLLYKNPNGTEIQAVITAEYVNQPQKLRASESDLVVLPEYGLDDITNQTLSQRFEGGLPRSFVGSQQKTVEAGQVRNILIYGNQNGYKEEIDKSRLIAGGEYMPYIVQGLLVATNNSREVENFYRERGVVRGADGLTPLRVSDDIVVGGAVCSSIISTEDYRKLTAQGATVLSNSASLGIFTGSAIFGMQHQGFAKFMAVANARPFLQSSSYGAAFALDHNGRLIHKITPIQSATVTVHTNEKRTPYTYLGEWMAIIGGIIVVCSMATSLYRRKRILH